MIFQSSAAHLVLATLKNNQILQKIWRKCRKIFQSLLLGTYMAAFGTKNVHSALCSGNKKNSEVVVLLRD